MNYKMNFNNEVTLFFLERRGSLLRPYYFLVDSLKFIHLNSCLILIVTIIGEKVA